MGEFADVAGQLLRVAESMENQLSKLNEEFSIQRAEKEQLEVKLNDAGGKIQELAEQVKNYRQRCKKLKEITDGQAERIAGLEETSKELENQREQVGQLTELVNQYRERQNQSIEQVNNLTESLQKSVDKRKQLIEQVREQAEQIEQHKGSINAYVEQFKTFQNRIGNLKEQNKAYEEQVKALEEQIKMLREQAKSYQNHIENKDIHKRPLNDDARQKSIAVRQSNAKKNAKNLCDAVECYWNWKIGQNGDSAQCDRVDMQWLKSKIGLTERSIREVVKQDSEKMLQYARVYKLMHLYSWVSRGCRFSNVDPRG